MWIQDMKATWIDAKVLLPKHDEFVLVAHMSSNGHLRTPVTGRYNAIEEKWYTVNWYTSSEADVTHWTYLPNWHNG